MTEGNERVFGRGHFVLDMAHDWLRHIESFSSKFLRRIAMSESIAIWVKLSPG